MIFQTIIFRLYVKLPGGKSFFSRWISWHFLKDYSQRWGDVLKNTDHKGHAMFSGLRTGRGWPVPALTGNNTFWAIYLGNLPGSACVIPTYHSNSCWKEMLIILLQYSNAATNCWYMLIYTQPKLSSNASSQPLLGRLQQHPFTHSHGRCHRARCHRGKKLRRNQNWKLRTKRWPCKMGRSPPQFRRFHHTGESYI